MLASQRYDFIVEYINQHAAVRVQDLVDELKVSDMTIRRDLDFLAMQGQLIKVHGGAVLSRDSSSLEPAFKVKSGLEKSAKDAIGHATLDLVKPGSAIAINAGTTTAAAATYLATIPNITVVTNSLKVAERMWNSKELGQVVILSGGVRTPSEALVGPVALENIRSLHLDILFMGVHGMSKDAGFTSPNLQEAETNRAFMSSASEIVVLVDSTKWGLVGLAGISRIDQVNKIITDSHISAEASDHIKAAGVELIVASGGIS
jgi:DeoR/GlpR family transcriptional regulator of sugar metabolism